MIARARRTVSIVTLVVLLVDAMLPVGSFPPVASAQGVVRSAASPPSASDALEGVAFFDADGSGDRTTSDRLLPDLLVHLLDHRGRELALTTTSSGGTFRFTDRALVPRVGTLPESSAAVSLEFSGDDLPDLALATREGLLLFRQNSDGSFAAPESLSLSQEETGTGASLVSSLVALDIDGDHDQDLLVALPSSLLSFRNRGEGRFEPRDTIPLDATNSLLPLNLDGDRDQDLLVLTPSALLSFETAEGRVPPPEAVRVTSLLAASGSSPVAGGAALAALDIAGDEAAELAVARGDTVTFYQVEDPTTVSEVGEWHFPPQESVEGSAGAGEVEAIRALAPLDLDADGRQDLLLATPRGLFVAFQEGPATFSLPLLLSENLGEVAALTLLDGGADPSERPGRAEGSPDLLLSRPGQPSVVIEGNVGPCTIVLDAGGLLDHLRPAFGNPPGTLPCTLAFRRFRGAPLSLPLTEREQGSAQVAGRVFSDVDGSGTLGAREAGLPGFTVTLSGFSRFGKQIALSTVTAEDGSYRFRDLPETIDQSLRFRLDASSLSGEILRAADAPDRDVRPTVSPDVPAHLGDTLGSSLLFSGTAALVVPSSPSLDAGADGMGLAAWVKVSGPGRIAARLGPAPPSRNSVPGAVEGFDLRVDRATDGTLTIVCSLALPGGSLMLRGAFEENVWHHVGCGVNARMLEAGLTLDGTLRDSGVLPVPWTSLAPRADLEIGGSSQSPPPTLHLSSLHLFSVPLTSDLLSVLHRGGEPHGYTVALEDEVFPLFVPTTPLAETVEISRPEEEVDLSFGLTDILAAAGRGSVEGTVVVRDTIAGREIAVAGVKVTLSGATSVATPYRGVVLTDAHGRFHFHPVPLSAEQGYVLSLDLGSFPVAVLPDGPTEGTVTVLSEGEIASMAFLVRLPSAAIRGRVFSDIDGDGERDRTDPPLAGVHVVLVQSGSSAVRVIPTLRDGTFDVPVRAGVYALTLSAATLPTFTLPTSTAALLVTVAEQEVVEVQSLSAHFVSPCEPPSLGCLTGRVYVDLLEDGISDRDDPGLPGVTLEFQRFAASGVPHEVSAFTDAQGNFAIPSVAYGPFLPRFNGDFLGTEYRSTTSLSAADVDGDRDLDLFVGNADAQRSEFYLNLGDGSFSAVGSPWHEVFVHAPGGYVVDSAFLDIDGDGDSDLLVGYDGQPNLLYENAGDRFLPPVPRFNAPRESGGDGAAEAATVDSGGGSATRDLLVDDFNQDGAPDVLLLNGGGTENTLYLSRGAGQFEPVAGPNGAAGREELRSSNVAALVPGPRGERTLVVASGSDGVSEAYAVRPNGTLRFLGEPFPATVSSSALRADSRALAVLDLDGRGGQDIVVGNRGSPNRCYWNEGDHVFTYAGVCFNDGVAGDRAGETSDFLVFDADADGDDDLLVVHHDSPNRLFRNDGHGTFTDLGPAFSAGLAGRTLSTRALAADLDGDGDRDVVIANTGDSPNELYLSFLADPFTLEPISGVPLGLEPLEAKSEARNPNSETSLYSSPSCPSSPFSLSCPSSSIVFPYRVPRSEVFGRVFLDIDADGRRSPEEGKGLPGVAVSLSGVSLFHRPLRLTGSTASPDGSFSFQDLLPSLGSYTVAVSGVPTGEFLGTTPLAASVPLVVGSSVDLSFGVAPPSSIAIDTFLDPDADGDREASARGVPGIALSLEGTTSLGEELRATVTSDASGMATFSDLLPARRVSESDASLMPRSEAEEGIEPSYRISLDPVSIPGDLIAVSPLTVDVPLPEVGSAERISFAFANAADLRGTVYLDRDGSSTRDLAAAVAPGEDDGGEIVLRDVLVRLTLRTAIGGEVVLTHRTLSGGSFHFPRLLPQAEPASLEVVCNDTPEDPGAGDAPDPRVLSGSSTEQGDARQAFLQHERREVALHPGTSETLEIGCVPLSSIQGRILVAASLLTQGARGITLVLTGALADGTPFSLSSTTRQDGVYSFSVPPPQVVDRVRPYPITVQVNVDPATLPLGTALPMQPFLALLEIAQGGITILPDLVLSGGSIPALLSGSLADPTLPDYGGLSFFAWQAKNGIPSIEEARYDLETGEKVISGRLEFALPVDPSTYAVALFMADSSDPTRHGPLGELLGLVPVVETGGELFFSFRGPGQPGGYVTAILVHPDGTRSLPSKNTHNATYTVDITDDDSGLTACTATDDDCSLRGAMSNANSNAGADTIQFNIPTADSGFSNGSWTIRVGGGVFPDEPLPAITERATIDATTQTNYTCGSLTVPTRVSVEIDGTDADNPFPPGTTASGFVIQASNVTIKGFVINRFLGDGIYIARGTGSKIQSNFIGTDSGGLLGADATVDLGNTFHGVKMSSGARLVTIGGSGSCAGNVISNNNSGGILSQAVFTGAGFSNNRIAGNFIGVERTGFGGLGNNRHGIEVRRGSGDLIGGDEATERNVVAGNGGDGIRLGSGAKVLSGTVTAVTGTTIQANYIGVNRGGTGAIANSGHGIFAMHKNGLTTIGGAIVGMRNVISGNLRYGILSHQSNVRILGNYIGVSASGAVVLANSAGGVRVASGRNLEITHRNVIAGNSQHGVFAAAVRTTTLTGNLIGISATGGAVRGNGGGGIILDRSTGATIGGVAKNYWNVIGGNRGSGITITGTTTTGTTIQANFIGTNSGQTIALANSGAGIHVSGGARSSTIGSRDPTASNSGSNVIANNGKLAGLDGVYLQGVSTDSHNIRGNIFWPRNKDLPIDLAGDGANDDLASPTLTNVTSNTASGTGLAGAVADIYSTTNGVGARFYHGEAAVDSTGNWEFRNGDQFTGTGILAMESVGAGTGVVSTDTFTRADNDTLGNDEFTPANAWTESGGSLRITSNQLRSYSSTSRKNTATVGISPAKDMEVSAVIAVDPSFGYALGVMGRVQTPVKKGRYFAALYRRSSTCQISLWYGNGKTEVRLTSYYTVTCTNGSARLKLKIQGLKLTAQYVRGTSKTTITYNASTSFNVNDPGVAGVIADGRSGMRWDGFLATTTRAVGSSSEFSAITQRGTPPAGQTLALTGTVFTDEAKTSPVGAGITIAYSSGYGLRTGATNAQGRFSIEATDVIDDDPVILFIDGDTQTGALVTRSDRATGKITGLDLITGKIILTSNTGGSLTNDDIDVVHDVDPTNEDCIITVSHFDVAATFADSCEVFIPSGKTYEPGTFFTSSGVDVNGTLRMSAAQGFVKGSFDATGGAVTLGGSGGIFTFMAPGRASITTNGYALSGVTFSGAGIWTLADALTASGVLTLSGGTVNGSTINAKNHVYLDKDFSGGTTNLTINGNGEQTLYGNESTSQGSLPVLTIAKSAGTLTLANVIRTTNNWTYTTGTVSAGTSTGVFAGTLTLDPQGSSSTMSFNDVLVNGGGTVTLGGNLQADRDLTIASATTLDASSNNYTITAKRHWSNFGTFTRRAGTVTFTGSTASILTGSTTFNNFTVSQPGKQLTLAATALQGMSGTLTLQGVQGNRVVLRSTQNETRARFNPSGSRTTRYVDVRDNNNINASAIQCTFGCLDSGNNLNWRFPRATMTGIVFTDEAKTSPVGANVTVGFSTGSNVRTADTNAQGRFALTGANLSVSDTVVFFIDGETQTGAALTRLHTGTALHDVTVTGLDLITGKAIVTNNTGGSITNTHLDLVDAVDAGNEDCISVSGGAATFANTCELLVDSGKTYAPGAAVTASGVLINGTVTLGGNLDANGRFRLSAGTFTQGDYQVNIADDVTLSNGTTFTRSPNQGIRKFILDGDLTLTDSNTTKQNLGYVQIGTSPDTTNLGSDTSYFKLDVGTGDTLRTCGYDITVGTGGVTIYGTLNATDPNASCSGNEGDETLITSQGDWTLKSGGTFTEDQSTVVLTGSLSPRLSGTVNFASLTIRKGSATPSLQGNTTVQGAFRLESGTFDVNDVTVTFNGDVDMSGGTYRTGTNTNTFGNAASDNVTISGGTLEIESDSTTADIAKTSSWNNSGGTIVYNAGSAISTSVLSSLSPYRNLQVNSAGSTYTGNGNLDINGTFTVTAGAFAQGTNQVNSSGSVSIANGATFTRSPDHRKKFILDGDLTLTDSNTTKQNLGYVQIGTSPDTTNLGSDTSYFKLDVGTGDTLNTCGYEVTVGTGGITIYGTLNASDPNATCPATEGDETTFTNQGNWTRKTSGTFLADDSTLVFTGSLTSTLSGSTTFRHVTVQQPGKQLTFAAGATQTVSGTLTLLGTSASKIVLRSSLTGVAWNIKPIANQTVRFVDVKDSTATQNFIYVLSGTDSGNNNFRWVFGVDSATQSGTVFIDRDGDGTKDTNERTGLANVTLDVSGKTFTGLTIARSAISTASSGAYTFSGVPTSSGAYTLSVTSGVPAGYLATTTTSRSITVTATGQTVQQHFGYSKVSTASGIVFEDLNANGALDGSDKNRLSGVTLRITGTTATGMTLTRKTVSNSTGRYIFSTLHISASSGVVAIWSFEESGGTLAQPSTGGVIGTLTNMELADRDSSVKTFTYPNDRSLLFDGSDEYVTMGNASKLNFGNGDFALSAWVRTSATATGVIAGKGERTGTAAGYLLVLTSAGKLRFYVGDNTNDEVVTSSTSINDGTWRHVLASRSGSTFRVYVNGTLEATGTDGSIGSTSTSEAFEVARNAAGSYFSGRIDEVRVYQRATTTAVITALSQGYPTEYVLYGSAATLPLGYGFSSDVSTGFYLTTEDQKRIVDFGAKRIAWVVDRTPDENLSGCTIVAGDCDLRGAMNRALGASGFDKVWFAVPTSDTGYSNGYWRITLDTAGTPNRGQLPALTDRAGTWIEASTQSGYTCTAGSRLSNPVIEVTHEATGTAQSAFRLDSSQNSIEAFVINGSVNSFGSEGILVSSGTGNTMSGNYIGTNTGGTLDATTGAGDGIKINGGSGSRIGGSGSCAGNLISGNTNGIAIQNGRGDNRVQGNFIGTAKNGKADLGNTTHGVSISSTATGNLIGGDQVTERNVISGNDTDGVRIANDENTAAGNLIGTTATGGSALPNTQDGISLFGNGSVSPDRNVIGGTSTTLANVLAGNNSDGISIVVTSGPSATGNVIQGNFIGTNTGQAIDLGNADYGIFLNGGNTTSAVDSTQIGPRSPSVSTGGMNVIAFNGNASGEDGITVVGDASDQNAIRASRFFGNTDLGIEIDETAENPGTKGANEAIPPPVITSASRRMVVGTSSGNAIIDVYSARNGENQGRFYEGTATASASGRWYFYKSGAHFQGTGTLATQTFTATGTSQFSSSTAQTSAVRVLTGTVFTNEAQTSNIGASKTVALSISGTTTIAEDTNSSGRFAFTGVLLLDTSDPVLLYLDDETDSGALVTRVSSVQKLTGIDLITTKAIIRNETGATVTNTHLDLLDGVDALNEDGITVSGGEATFVDTLELFINAGDTYAPGGAVTASGIDINGTFTMDTNAVTVRASWDAAGGTFSGTNRVTFRSLFPETITSNANAFSGVTFSGTGGTWTLSDALDANGAFALTRGTFVQGGNQVNIADDVTLSAGTTFTRSPNQGVRKVILDGDLSLTDSNTTKQNLGYVQVGTSPDTTNVSSDITVFKLDVGTGDTLNTCGYEVTVGTGGVTVYGTLNTSEPNAACPATEGNETTITNNGNWTKKSSATFTKDESTVVFTGALTAIITGTTLFHHFTVAVAGKQLTFASTAQQSMSGTLTMSGSIGNRILLRSSQTNVQWKIAPSGSRSVKAVNVQDSNNVRLPIIDPTDSFDAGNTTNWFATGVGTASGMVFTDTDGDGLLDSGESGIASVSMILSGFTLTGGTVRRTTTTDSAGRFTFTSATIPSSGNLLAYYSFEEGDGTTIRNRVQGLLTGTLLSTTGAIFQRRVPPADFSDRYSLFYPKADGRVQVSNASSINNLPLFSLAAWMRADSSGEGGSGRILDKANTNADGAFVLRLSSGGHLVFDAKRWATTDGSWRYATDLRDSSWHHVAVTYNYGATGNDPTVYVDGSSVSIVEDTSPAGSAASETEDLTIGNRAGRDRSFAGHLDDVRLYLKLLSATDVSRLAQGRPEFGYTVLVSGATLPANRAGTRGRRAGVYFTANGAVSTGSLFGFAPLSTLTGSLFDDENGNGSKQEYEPYLTGATVVLLGSTATGSATRRTNVTTTSTGAYQFLTSLAPSAGTGISAYYPFDTGTGTDTLDFSGNASHGVLKNMVQSSWSGATVAKAPLIFQNRFALDFDGTNDYVRAAHTGALNFGTSPFTVVVWVRTDEVIDWRWAVSKHLCTGAGCVTADNNGFRIGMDAAGKWIFRDRSSGVDTTGSRAMTGTWTHIAWVREGTASNQLKLYVNGVQDATGTSAGNFTNQADLLIGSWNGVDTDFWNGQIDDVRVYNRPLTAAEVLELASGYSKGYLVEASGATLPNRDYVGTNAPRVINVLTGSVTVKQNLGYRYGVTVAFVSSTGVVLPALVSYSFPSITPQTSIRTSTGTWTTNAKRMRVRNTLSGTKTLLLEVLAASGVTAKWRSTTTGSTFDFNSTNTGNGVLKVKPSTALLTKSGCTLGSSTLGSETTFRQGVRDVLTLATITIPPGVCDFTYTGFTLIQYVPAYQRQGNYSLRFRNKARRQ